MSANQPPRGNDADSRVLRHGALAVAIAVAVAIALAACGGGEDEGTSEPNATGSATPGASATPDATTTSTNGDEYGLSFEEAPDALEFYEGSAEDAASEDPQDVYDGEGGVFFVDIPTGDTEGWRLTDGEVAPRMISPDNRFAGASVPDRGGGIIADREDRTVYRWSGEAQPVPMQRPAAGNTELAAGGSHVLFRVPGDESGFDILVADFDGKPRVVHRLPSDEDGKMAAGTAVISPDGERVAVLAEGLVITEVATGDREAADVDTEGLISQPLAQTRSGHIVVKREDSWSMVDWDGRTIGGGDETLQFSGFFSPDGEQLATVQHIAPCPEAGECHSRAKVVDVVNTADGSPALRIYGARWPDHAHYPWLADGSGLVAKAPASEPGYSQEFVFAYADGEVEPVPGDGQPFPSPDDPDTLLVGQEIIDRGGKVRATIDLDWGDHYLFPRWGTVGGEVRVVRLPSGHDHGGYTSSLVLPQVQAPPYDEAPTVELHSRAGGLPLVEDPESGEIVDRLEAPLEVAIHEQWSPDWYGGGVGAPGQPVWFRVTIASDTEGWLEISDVHPRVATGDDECLRVRREASTESDILACYDEGVTLAAGWPMQNTGEAPEGWRPVSTLDGRAGWVAEEFVEQPGRD